MLRRLSARLCACLVIVALGLAGCTAAGSGDGGTSSHKTSTPTTVASPSTLLTQPGMARQAINALLKAADTDTVVKVDISAHEASLSIVRNDKPLTWAWEDGVVAPAESDIANIKQTSFEPRKFNIDNVGELFAEAAATAGSAQNQQLQIVEYNQGQVLMTVTTNPESATVFFRPDGTEVHHLDFTTSAGIREGLSDCLAGHTKVLAVGFDPDTGMYCDLGSTSEGVVTEVSRPATLPPWSAQVKKDTPDQFDAALIQPDVIAGLLAHWETADSSGSASATPTGSASASASAGAQPPKFSWVIDRRDKLAQPVLRLSVRGTTHAYTVTGTDITALLGA